MLVLMEVGGERVCAMDLVRVVIGGDGWALALTSHGDGLTLSLVAIEVQGSCWRWCSLALASEVMEGGRRCLAMAMARRWRVAMVK